MSDLNNRENEVRGNRHSPYYLTFLQVWWWWWFRWFSRTAVSLCDCVDCNPPGSSVLAILQARILEWVAISFSRGPS